METKTIIFEGIKMMVFFKELPSEDADWSVGFSGKDSWKQLERVTVGGVDITPLVGECFEQIEIQLNNG